MERLENRTLLTAAPYGATPEDTGEFMLGDVYVTVVLMESNSQLSGVNDNSEDWSSALINEVKTKIDEGLQWWEDTLSSVTDKHELDFIMDYTYADDPVSTAYEPIINPSTAFSSWIYDFLSPVGFNRTGNFSSDIRAFNHAQREEHGTDWAFTIFVVNDANDADGHFAPGGFDKAFAFSGGRFFVTPAGRPASTFSHETGHMFWALDEYPGGGTYTSSRGYYNTQNSNAWDNPLFTNPNSGVVQQPSIMASGGNRGDLLYQAYTTNTSSQSSLEMIGWRDSDGDGVFDVLDVPHTLTGSGYNDVAESVYRFVGQSSVQTLPNENSSGLQNDITISEISRAEFRVDGGPWQTAAVYDAYSVTLDLSIPLPLNAQEIEIRTVDDITGITSSVFRGNMMQPSSVLASGINGFVWNDVDADGAWDPDERGVPGVTLQLVDDSGNPLDLRKAIEPDDYVSDTTLLNDIIPGVSLSAIGSGVADPSVTAIDASAASTGDRVFANFSTAGSGCNGFCAQWTDDSRQLRLDFNSPVTTVSIDAVANSEGDYARLEIYDANDQLLGRFTTGAMSTGSRETMTQARLSGDISYAIARGHMDSSVHFDNLEFGPQGSVVTDELGSYSLSLLEPGAYTIQVVLGPTQASTSPASASLAVTLQPGESLDKIDFGIQSDGSPWQNPSNRFDVNADGHVTPIDALQIINELNRGGARELSASDWPPPYLDVSGDAFVAPGDVLLVINEINRLDPAEAEVHEGRRAASGVGGVENVEGEAELSDAIALGSFAGAIPPFGGGHIIRVTEYPSHSLANGKARAFPTTGPSTSVEDSRSTPGRAISMAGSSALLATSFAIEERDGVRERASEGELRSSPDLPLLESALDDMATEIAEIWFL